MELITRPGSEIETGTDTNEAEGTNSERTHELERDDVLLREKSPNESDGNNESRDGTAENARLRGGSGGGVAVADVAVAVCVYVVWTLECTTTSCVDTPDVHGSPEASI